jgi:hypothetical protein
MDFDDKINEVMELKKMAQELLDHLDCAESSENDEDLMANLDNALDSSKEIVAVLKELAVETDED